MKILMVNKFLYPNGGSETYIFKIGKQLEKTGHEVQYFGMEHPERVVGNRVGSYTSSMDFHTGKLQKLMYPFNIFFSLECRRKIRRVLDDFCPDIVHLNNFNFQLTPSILYEIRRFDKKNKKKNKKKTGILYTAHDYQWICPNHRMQIPETGELCSRCMDGKYGNCTKYKCIHNSKVKSLLGTVEAGLYRRLGTYRLVDAVICPSRFMEKMLEGNPALRGRTVMMHNFMDGAAQTGEGKTGDYVLYFGRYSEEKGIRTLAKVCRMLPDIPFVCAGSGPLEAELKAVPNIRLKGFLKGRELQELIENARFVVFPSEWYENCPFSVMEAQRYGTPVLASRLGGTPELIREGVTGELFEAGNAEEFKQKIGRLWQQEELCREYASNCRCLPFDGLEEYCRKLLKLYGKLC